MANIAIGARPTPETVNAIEGKDYRWDDSFANATGWVVQITARDTEVFTYWTAPAPGTDCPRNATVEELISMVHATRVWEGDIRVKGAN